MILLADVLRNGYTIKEGIEKQKWYGQLLYIENGEFKEIEDLSAGYQSILNLVIDLAYRMVVLNPDAAMDIREIEGIVLIDEIDSNLHPKWQWKIVDALTGTFPNVQFIAATHSPIIVSSCKNANIININEKQEVRYIEDSYPAFGAIQGMNEPLLTNEGAHFLVWQRKYPGHKEEKWHGMSNCHIEEILFERLSSEEWHDDVCDIKKRNQFDAVYVTHCTVNRLMEELCHYENELLRTVLDCIQYMNNVQIISADLGEQLVVREKTIYDEPGSTIAVAIAKKCLAVVSEPDIIEKTITTFRNNIVRVIDFDKLL